MPSDNELMASVKNGDLEKLAVLYQKYNRALFVFFFKMTSNAQASEDLVQSVFFKIIKYRDRYRENDGHFATWLFRIAHNARIDHYHKAKHLHNASDVGDLDLKSDSDTEAEFQKKEKSVLMREALDRLTDTQRETLIMSRFHDMTYEEIAKVMNCRVGTIKARVFRAMETLRETFRALERT